MSRVKAQELLIGERVAEIELMRPDNVALRTDAEQLAFNGIQVIQRVELLGEDLVQRSLQDGPRRLAVHRDVLEAVRDPDVGDARGAEFPAEPLPDLAARNAMSHPELPDPFIAAAEREAVGRLGMGEERAIEIQSQPALSGPVDPAGE